MRLRRWVWELIWARLRLRQVQVGLGGLSAWSSCASLREELPASTRRRSTRDITIVGGLVKCLFLVGQVKFSADIESEISNPLPQICFSKKTGAIKGFYCQHDSVQKKSQENELNLEYISNHSDVLAAEPTFCFMG